MCNLLLEKNIYVKVKIQLHIEKLIKAEFNIDDIFNVRKKKVTVKSKCECSINTLVQARIYLKSED